MEATILTKPNFKPKNIVSLVRQKTKFGLSAVQKAKKGSNWDEVFTPLDEAELELKRVLNINSHLNAVAFNDSFNAEYEKTLPIINDYYHKLSTDKELYQAFLLLKNTPLNKQQQHILSDVILDFELSGLNLSKDKLAKLKTINQNLSLLANKFAKNTLQATNQWQKSIGISELGKNYPTHLLPKLKTNSGYRLNLQAPVYLDVMTYCANSNLRKEVYIAYISRASDVGITSIKYDNSAIMNKILQLRTKKAQLLGFNNYAQISLVKKMVQEPSQVVSFLEDLIIKIKPQAKAELAELEAFAAKKLNPWDLAFYSERLKQAKFGFSKTELLPYFPEQRVLSGLFKLIYQLYQVKISPIKEKSYQSNVKVFILTYKNSIIGKIYLDIYARKNKRSGAWMADYQGLNNKHKPVAFVVCNLNAPSKDKPALFEFDEIITLFHEFGHALHHLLTTVKYPRAAGIDGVPWDGVELPSQMMENFCYEKTVITNISKHYRSNKPLPDDLYQKLIKGRNFQTAMQLLRQCEFSLWDIKAHLNNKPPLEVLAEVRAKTALIPPVAENRFLNSFGHIFNGGYAAGYYSYLWAEVLAADAFSYLKKHKFNKTVVSSFKDNILSIGGSADFMPQYRQFRGKNPSAHALLKSRGIITSLKQLSKTMNSIN